MNSGSRAMPLANTAGFVGREMIAREANVLKVVTAMNH
jgi:hypothetical protein